MTGSIRKRLLSVVLVVSALCFAAFGFAYQFGTPLILAAWHGDFTIVDALLKAGANVNASNHNGMTALEASTWGDTGRGDVRIAKRLLASGANVNTKNHLGRTALMEVAGSGNFEFVVLLLENGADVNATTSGGGTALHEAALNSHSNIVSVLLSKGAKTNLANELGQTPIMLAANCVVPGGSCPERTEIVKMLINAGADVNAKDINGNSVLRSVMSGTNAEREQVKKLLLNAGALP